LPDRYRGAAALLCALLMAALPARGVVSITAGPNGDGVIINTLLGADRFYDNGYFGQNSVVANIESGAIWNGHETLTQVDTYIQDPSILGTQLGQFDFHATAVGMTIGGQGQFFYYQAGIAPLTKLWSGSIATQFHNDGTFEITDQSFIYAYTQSMLVGRDVTYSLYGGGITFTVHRTADVINSSWGFDDPTGETFETKTIDALVLASGTTFVASAGNDGPGRSTVVAPAAGFNRISVAALGSDNTPNPYTLTAGFSSRGPGDFFNPKTGRTLHGVRATVDIAAPGDELTLAYYGGTTGSNTGGTDDSSGANNYYWTNAAGTSFSAPIVAGGAALVADYAHANFGPHGYDGRVIKAVLLNSADKTPGWDNGQETSVRSAQTFVRTTQGLDWTTGAGRMNLNHAYDQLTAGTTDTPTLSGGHVQPVGWAYGRAAVDAPVDYIIDSPFAAGDSLTATLTWFVHRSFTDAAATADASAADDYFTNLNLQVWLLDHGVPLREVAESASLFNNVEHLSFPLPESGQYMLRVVLAGDIYNLTATDPTALPPPEDFGIAWSNLMVPEPAATIVIVVFAVATLGRRRPGMGREYEGGAGRRLPCVFASRG
jgi:Subtilase family